jgi:hypothetical protein
MNINIAQLQERLCTLMCAQVQILDRGQGHFLVKTPFYFPDGDPYLIYIQERPAGLIRLTDAGHTLMHLSYEHDMDHFREGTRGRLLEQILSETDVAEAGGEFYVDLTIEQIPDALFRLGQALTKVYDLTFLNRARVESTFYEDLEKALRQIVEPDKITKDYIYQPMPNAQDYPIDYCIRGKTDPLFVFGVLNQDKVRLATIILEHLLRAGARFESVLIFEDQGKIARNDLARLSNVGGEMVASLNAQDDLRRKVLRRAA